MILEKWLVPDLCVKGYGDVTPELVKELGGKALLCDIDNTLATYDDAKPPRALVDWIENMGACGIRIAFVSNNCHKRVAGFNEELGLVAYARAGKPGSKYLNKAVLDLGIDKSEAVFMGDQLLTDCAAAKNYGIPVIIVSPIKDKTTPFFKFKRMLEIPYMKKYEKINNKSED